MPRKAIKASLIELKKNLKEIVVSGKYPELEEVDSKLDSIIDKIEDSSDDSLKEVVGGINKSVSELEVSHPSITSTLNPLSDDYDLIFIDCPAGISIDAESVFYAADLILIPIIPTILSMETFQKILSFLKEKQHPKNKTIAFFSQVDARKKIHKETVAKYTTNSKWYLKSTIPYLSEIERMGIYRAPVTAKLPKSRSAIAFTSLWQEISDRFL